MTWEHKGDAGTSKISGVTWEHFLDQRSLQSIGRAINFVLCLILMINLLHTFLYVNDIQRNKSFLTVEKAVGWSVGN